MNVLQQKQRRASLRKKRVRGKLFGTSERPRLTIFRSNKNTYVQVVNDEKGVTIASANDLMLGKKSKKALTGTKLEKAGLIAEAIAQQLQKQKVTKLCFDRGSYRYHGRLKAIADTLRQAGVEV